MAFRLFGSCRRSATLKNKKLKSSKKSRNPDKKKENTLKIPDSEIGNDFQEIHYDCDSIFNEEINQQSSQIWLLDSNLCQLQNSTNFVRIPLENIPEENFEEIEEAEFQRNSDFYNTQEYIPNSYQIYPYQNYSNYTRRIPYYYNNSNYNYRYPNSYYYNYDNSCGIAQNSAQNLQYDNDCYYYQQQSVDRQQRRVTALTKDGHNVGASRQYYDEISVVPMSHGQCRMVQSLCAPQSPKPITTSERRRTASNNMNNTIVYEHHPRNRSSKTPAPSIPPQSSTELPSINDNNRPRRHHSLDIKAKTKKLFATKTPETKTITVPSSSRQEETNPKKAEKHKSKSKSKTTESRKTDTKQTKEASKNNKKKTIINNDNNDNNDYKMKDNKFVLPLALSNVKGHSSKRKASSDGKSSSKEVKTKVKVKQGVTSLPSAANTIGSVGGTVVPSSAVPQSSVTPQQQQQQAPTNSVRPQSNNGQNTNMAPSNGGGVIGVGHLNSPQTQSMERVGWEYHTIQLTRLPAYGFGIAISGGRDNPHFMNGDPSIAISDVLKSGPAEGKLMINDRIISANGISLENVDYLQAIQVLRECVNTVSLLIKRRALIPPPVDSDSIEVNNNPFKVTLTKLNKKDDFGIVIGCKFYIKEVKGKTNVVEKDMMLLEGDILHKINNHSLDGMSLKDVKKLIEGKDKSLSLMITRNDSNYSGSSPSPNNESNTHSTPIVSRINTSHLNNSSSFCTPPRFQSQIPDYNGNLKGHNEQSMMPPHLQAAQQQQHQQSLHQTTPNGNQNGYSKQNLYVQSPVRNSLHQRQVSSVQGSPQENSNTSATNQEQQQASQQQQQQNSCETPEEDPKSELSSLDVASGSTSGNVSPNGEVRTISFIKEGSVGIRLTGGNEVGIFVTAVQPGSPAAAQGLKVGDKILSANTTQMLGHTREEAVLFLLKIQDKIDLVVQNCPQEYETILANQKGDSFHVRAHFNFDSEGKGELSFHTGDVFHVVDTLFNGVVGSWFVYRLGRNNQEIQKGSIPNRSRAEELAIEARSKTKNGLDESKDSSSKRGGFFKRRRSVKRSKSFSKDHWEDLVFGDSVSKCPAYERVQLKHPGFVRPVVFFGPLADIVREKLLRDYPQRFATPQPIAPTGDDCEDVKKSGIVRLSAIKDVIESGKHALLDITPAAVDRLNYAQFYPIVIFMRTESKSVVKELRNRSSSKITVRRSSRKLFDQSLKLEKNWYHIFTSSVTLTTGGDTWYKNITEIIEKQQSSMIWMADSAPPPSSESDFLFPMLSSRMSYAASSGAESDADFDLPGDDSRLDDENDDPRKFASQPSLLSRINRASSDPSLAQEESSKTGNKNISKDSPEKNKISPGKVPLHILLRKELAKALQTHETKKAEMQDHTPQVPPHVLNAQPPLPPAPPQSQPPTEVPEPKQQQQQQQQPPPQPTLPSSQPEPQGDIFSYPTLRIQDKFPEPATTTSSTMPPSSSAQITNANGVVSATPAQTVPDSPLPPPPPTSLPPAITPPPSSNPLSMLDTPPRVDRNSKPNRFRSAHERLFGPMSSQPHIDESDYINTAELPDYETQMRLMRPTVPSGNMSAGPGSHSRQMESNSSFSSDSYNKYKPRNGQVPPPLNITGSTRATGFDNTSKSLPPLPTDNNNLNMKDQAIRNSPPSPPPKPKPINNSLQYQMNGLSLNDRPLPPPKKSSSSLHQQQLSMSGVSGYDPSADYDNIPPIRDLSRNNSFVTRPSQRPQQQQAPPPLPDMNPMNGPSFYPQQQTPQLPPPQQQPVPYGASRSAYVVQPEMVHGYSGQEMAQHFQYPPINRSRPPSQYYDMPPYDNQAEYSNYDSVRSMSQFTQGYPPPPQAPPPSNGGYQTDQLYLNVPFKGYSGNSANFSRATNLSESSPLPPPPPLPSHHHYASQLPGLVQPTPQPASSTSFIDLTRERVSAFEPYRKPQQTVPATELFQGLPPPPPPLTVNDYNEYTNLEQMPVMTPTYSDGNNNPYAFQFHQESYAQQEIAQLIKAPAVPPDVYSGVNNGIRAIRF